MRLGFAVKVLGAGGLPSHDTRRWQSEPHLRVSLDHLEAILGYLDDHDIRMYRMATGLAPYASHPDLTRFHGQPPECARAPGAGRRARAALGVRLSTHPGQYTVLNSEDAADPAPRRRASSRCRPSSSTGWAWAPRRSSCCTSAVPAAGRTPRRPLRARFDLLSDAARARLVIENDDRTFGLRDLLTLSTRTAARWCGTSCTTTATTPSGSPTRGAAPRARHLARRGPAEDPLLLAQDGGRGAQASRGPARRALARPPPAPRPRRHGRPDRLRALRLRHGPRPATSTSCSRPRRKDLALLRLRDQLAARGVALSGSRNGAGSAGAVA